MDFSLLEMWKAMGFAARAVVVTLGVMSTWVLAVSFERLRLLRRERLASDAFVGAVSKVLGDSGPALPRLAAVAETHRLASAARVTLEAATLLGRAAKADVAELVVSARSAVQRAVERETAILSRGLGALATIASTAPFVGLFGTVVGIISAFQSMAKSGSGGLASVSAGIAEALVTTAFGLLVAIPSVALYNYLTGLVDGVALDMREIGAEVLERALVERGDEA